MKLNKIFLFALPALLLIGMTACSSDNDDDNNGGSGSDSAATIVGDWYEETKNEEVSFSPNGTFYDRYSNPERCAETEGRYTYDPSTNRLTRMYTLIGQSQIQDDKIKQLDAYKLVISSTDYVELTCERIVQKYTLNAGDTKAITLPSEYANVDVYTYESKNERLASVSRDGFITATGEKGTTYIKLTTSKGNLWVRVTVGDDCLDLWYNYPSLIGKEISDVNKILGQPASNFGYGWGYKYNTDLSVYLSSVSVILDRTTRLVEDITINLRISVPEATILSYINSHYYPYDKAGANYWTTANSIGNSTAVVFYDKTKRQIKFTNAASANGFPDYTYTFGYTLSQLTKIFGDTYQGLPLFLINDNDYVESIYYVLDNTTKKATAFMLTLKSTVKESDMKDILSKKYNLYKSTDGMHAFYDGKTYESSKILVVYNPAEKSVTYFDKLNYKSSSSSKLNNAAIELFLDD